MYQNKINLQLLSYSGSLLQCRHTTESKLSNKQTKTIHTQRHTQSHAPKNNTHQKNNTRQKTTVSTSRKHSIPNLAIPKSLRNKLFLPPSEQFILGSLKHSQMGVLGQKLVTLSQATNAACIFRPFQRVNIRLSTAGIYNINACQLPRHNSI